MVVAMNDSIEVIPLITCTDGKYSVCESTLQWLASLDEFGVIACAGKYRTGKSFLLNRLTKSGANAGFRVGDTVQACTKGLWVYKKMFACETGNVIFMDTEGIDALDADDSHDVRIFTLALLLSSTFVYNSTGPIDETALQTLSLMTRVSEHVRVDHQHNTMGDIAPHMPKFLWILRDLSLKLTNRQHEPINEAQYLEEALQGSSEPNKNVVRDAIKYSFPHRTLITLPRPSTRMDPSQRMEDKLKSLSPQFVRGVDSLRTVLFRETLPMSADGCHLTGSMYAALCRHYIHVVQSGAVPVLRDSWSIMADVKARDLEERLVTLCEQTLSTMTPRSAEKLNVDVMRLRHDLLLEFDRCSMKPVSEDIRITMCAKLDTRIAQSRQALEINTVDNIAHSLDGLDALIDADPEKLSQIINGALDAFSENHGDEPESVKLWMASAHERALCRWIPRVIQNLCTQRDRMSSDLIKLSNEIRQKDENALDSIHAESVKYSELSQLHDSSMCILHCERDNNARMHFEMSTLGIEMNAMEESLRILSSRAESDVDEGEEGVELPPVEAQYIIENAELRSRLVSECNRLEKLKQEQKDTNARLERCTDTHKQLEQNWKQGIEKLQEVKESTHALQAAEYHKKYKQWNSDFLKMKRERDSESARADMLTEEKKCMKDKHTRESESHEVMVTHLRDTAMRHREQCELAQQRVLDMHKGILDDLRVRDERSREHQSRVLKETAQYQQRISEISRDNERQKIETKQLKRHATHMESDAMDCKRLRVSDREKDIIIAQLKAENSELRLTNAEMTTNRESITRENMSMEGDLVLLRAEKQMWTAQQTMSSISEQISIN